jgi:hypothetical protein
VTLETVFRFDQAKYRIGEGEVALHIRINREGGLTKPARVEWATVAGSAEPQLDYEGSWNELIEFAPGEESKLVFIPIVSDVEVERDETFLVVLRQPESEEAIDEASAVMVTIVDDDL